jgi:hypothetical protein
MVGVMLVVDDLFLVNVIATAAAVAAVAAVVVVVVVVVVGQSTVQCTVSAVKLLIGQWISVRRELFHVDQIGGRFSQSHADNHHFCKHEQSNCLDGFPQFAVFTASGDQFCGLTNLFGFGLLELVFEGVDMRYFLEQLLVRRHEQFDVGVALMHAAVVVFRCTNDDIKVRKQR